jgi:thiol-disulfide isomerase/thioredoxin
VLERPFLALGRRSGPSLASDSGGGFLLGVSLGLLFTPCAGPVIAAIATVAATQTWSVEAVAVTFAYAAGAGVVLLALAVAVRRGLSLAPLRARARAVRAGLGALVLASAAIMALGLDARLATNVPGYTAAFQELESAGGVQRELRELVSAEPTAAAAAVGAGGDLEDYGEAPDFRAISLWLNSQPLTLAGLRGKVVVIDFWTYSCVNCLRTLPFVKRWYETYRDDGLVIVGVHTPEFSFEREAGNVRDAVANLGIRYPVALDNDYGTWTAWGNRYWPAKYFIDRRGHVRYAHFGEGAYEESEAVIRELLAEPALPPPVSGAIEDRTPTGPQTPETYLGYQRLTSYVGSPIRPHRMARYEIPQTIPLHGVAYGGWWEIDPERIVAGRNARLRLVYEAEAVHLVLGTNGKPGTVQVALDGRPLPTIRVTEDRLYTLARTPGDRGRSHNLELSFSPGTEAYAFTFG